MTENRTTTDLTASRVELAARIRSEANIASRAGQYDRLHAIADDVALLELEWARASTTLDAAADAITALASALEVTDTARKAAHDAAWAQFVRMPSSNPGDITNAALRALEAALSTPTEGNE